METSASELKSPVSKHFHLISHRGSQLFIGWLHCRPGGPHFDTFAVGSISLLLLEKVGQKRKLITTSEQEKCVSEIKNKGHMGWI